jgi:hypothetical protein
MVKKILFSMLGFIALQVQAQLLKPLGQGIPMIQTFDEVMATTTDSTFLYAATRHYNGTTHGFIVTVNKWNGFYWQQLPPIVFDSSSFVKTIAVYKNQVYLAGNFTVKYPYITNTRTIVRFNTILNKWEGVSNFSFLNGYGSINAMAVFHEKLFIAGSFTTIPNGNDTTYNIVRYDGSTFNRCGSGTIAQNTGTYGPINSLLVLNDSLFLGGLFTKAGGLPSYNLAALDNNLSWKSFSITSITGISKLIVYQNNLALLTTDITSPKIFLRNSTGFQLITTNLSLPYQISDFEEYNNELWASGSFFSNSTSIIKYSTGWSSVNIPALSVYDLFKFRTGLYLVSASDVAGTVRINKLAQIVFSQTRISGHVYFDGNHNCKFDNNIDRPFANKILHFTGADNFNIRTDSDGYYSVTIPAGTYTISLLKFKNWEIDSPCTSSTFTITGSNNAIFDSLDFSLKPSAIGSDIKISITPNSGYSSFRDLTEEYTVTFSNNGTQDISNAAVKVVFNNKLINFASPQSPIINGNEALWSIPSLAVGQQRSISFTAKATATSFNVNDKLNFIASSALPDLDNTDNADTLIQRVEELTPTQVLKDISPLPPVNDSFSLITATQNDVNYIIHFENTSMTDTIHNIIVIDTLDVNSTIQYIQETGASHAYTTRLYSCPPAMGKGVIVWTFANINLPPYEINDNVNNRGHIGFKIQFKNSLPPLGTIIKNKADVIFDFYDPLKTNITYAKVALDVAGIKSNSNSYNAQRICANPVSHQIILFNTYEMRTSYRIINAAGALVMQGDINSCTIDVNELATGMYLLMLENEKEITSQKIIIK